MFATNKRHHIARIISAFAAVVLLAAGHVANAQTTQRPIEDFVNAQGTFCFPDGGGGCLLFVPPIENFFGQSDPANGRLSSVDYAGLADEWITAETGGAISFGTTFSGTIRERPLADGRADVHVILHTNNALTWVTEGDDFNNPLLFGSRAPDVKDFGAEPALGRSTLIIDFILANPGDPMPDLLQLAVFPEPGQEFTTLSVRARAKGLLREAFGVPDGTPGRFSTVQTNVANPGGGATEDGFPVERIDLRVIRGGRQ